MTPDPKPPTSDPVAPLSRIVILTGSPGAGKDEVAHIICANATGGKWVLDHFSTELQERCHGAYKLYTKSGHLAVSGTFEDAMDTPIEVFEGLSPRRAYDDFQDWAESRLGSAIMGTWLVKRVEFFIKRQAEKILKIEDRARNLCLADSANHASVQKLMEAFPTAQFFTVNVFRPGCGPSHRSLVRGTINIENDGTPEELEVKVRAALPFLFAVETTNV